MKIATLSLWLLCSLGNLGAAAPTDADSKNDPETLASRGIAKIQRQYEDKIENSVSSTNSQCTEKNMLYRQEWGSLSKQQRTDYIKAVQCLQSKPSKYSKSEVPGARSRYDDFSATHIKQTPYVHFSGLFLHFHRYLVYLYEKALRDECGYKGAQPYWDWTLSWQDPAKSTVFDGSPWSLGSNGKAIPHGPTNISAFGITASIPPGTGGGCISGPFENYTVHLGPVAYEPKGPDGGLGYNPRCLTRDINPAWTNNTRPTNVLSLLQNCTDIGCFDNQLEALSGVHASGHFSMGGLGLDAYASAGDPAFWVHHAQVDRVWTLWQSLNFKNRTMQTFGTGTAFNNPPSDPITLKTLIEYNVLAPKESVADITSTIGGPFCYMYI